MKFIKIFAIFLLVSSGHSNYSSNENTSVSLAAKRTRSMALLFSFIQCFPNNSSSLDADSRSLLQIHQTFNPESHLNKYTNLTDIVNLVAFVQTFDENNPPSDLPFTNSLKDIHDLNLVLTVLYHNTENWTLFYNTAVWLLQRVNSSMLFWALMIVSAERFSDTVTVPAAAEIFPQLSIPKSFVLEAAGLGQRSALVQHPLHYWRNDPGLNNFHTHWHMSNPFWWSEEVYGVKRDRRGELFLYMHHQIISRFNAELLSNGMEEVEPLDINPDYVIPEGCNPDIVNINYVPFFNREDNKKFGDFDNGTFLRTLEESYERLSRGIEQGYFVGTQDNHVSLQGGNGTDILGATEEASTVDSANLAFYGRLHNYLHNILGGFARPADFPGPGLQAHQETAMRDLVFYKLHKKIDTLYVKYKKTVSAYTQDDLEFSGISVLAVDILTRPKDNQDIHWRPNSQEVHWPISEQNSYTKPNLTTYLVNRTYDISNAARPCRAINDEQVRAPIEVLTYVPFSYVIAIQSLRPTVAYGMVRIFLWPKYTLDGQLLKGDAAHERAIELDRFRVRIEPGRATVLTRFSLESSLTRLTPSPGIKTLYNVKDDSDLITKPYIRRACAFPNNLLIPIGTEEGLPFKLTVYVSDETDAGDIEDSQYPHYPYCGALNGLPFPDKRPMGFPFDRPGTRFNRPPIVELSAELGGSPTIKNVKEIELLIKHVNE